MTIYEKLNKAKLAIQAAGIKKTGQNKFAGYEYFELADFMPAIIALESELQFCCIVSFDKESAILRIVDAEKPDSLITFASPMSSANLKGMHDVQNLGAVQTYLRRYLYVNAFEIVEKDGLDALKADKPDANAQNDRAKAPNQQAKPSQKITDEQFRVLADACMAWGKDNAEQEKARLREVYTKHGYKSARDIDQKDFEQIKTEFVEYGLPEGMGGSL